MKKIILLTLILSVFACGKYTTPRKVNNKLVDGSWNISNFTDNGVSLSQRFSDVTFTFGEDGSVLTTSPSAVSGTWDVGTDKNPALIYINFPTETDSMHVFTDDWVVYKLTKSECILKRNMEAGFDYDSSLDGLTLLKKQL